MILDSLFIALVILALFQPTAPRTYAALIFISVTVLHDVFLSHLDGVYYYGSAALFDLAIIMLTSGIAPIPRMVIDLHDVCIVSAIANFIGWILWALYFPPFIYDVVFMAIYGWVAVLFIKRNVDDVGGHSFSSWGACFHFDHGSRSCLRNKGKIKI